MSRDHVPVCVRITLLPDEQATIDGNDGQWYGIKDGDSEEWRNVRPLGIFTVDGNTGRNCDVMTPDGPFAAYAETVKATMNTIMAERDAARAEVARLRARVRVTTEDVDRLGVTWAHVHAWLAASPHWVRIDDGMHPSGPIWRREHVGVIGELVGIVHAICVIADGERRPSLDILDKMSVLAPERAPE